MENYDDDFSTLKAPKSLRWKPDIHTTDGDATIKHKPTNNLFEGAADFDYDFDDAFADEFESAVLNKKQPVQHEILPDAFLSDSSSKSYGNASAASGMSATSVDTDFGDEDFEEFDEFDVDVRTLKQRFQKRQQRAETAARCELGNDLGELDFEQLAYLAQTGTVNKNVKIEKIDKRTKSGYFNGTHIPQTSHQLKQQMQGVEDPQPNSNRRVSAQNWQQQGYSQQFSQPFGQQQQIVHNNYNNNQQQPAVLRTSQSSRMLRGMRSVAQLQNKNDSRLRGAVSMLDLNKPQHTIKQRPLTAYKEPPKLRSKPSRIKPNKACLIRNPLPRLSKQEHSGMVLNPQTGLWEGNDVDASKFDFEPSKPTLITTPYEPKQTEMLFDKRTLSWVYANEDEYEDPFEQIDEELESGPTQDQFEPQRQPMTQHFPNRSVRSESSTSTSSYGRSSVARSEVSSSEVFEIRPKTLADWQHQDDRFMRKFGRWIGGEEEKQDMMHSDQHFYEMVRNA